MSKVTSDMSMSLDGFITGPNDDKEKPLGEGVDRLHQWMYGLESFRRPHGMSGGEKNRDSEVIDESLKRAKAVAGDKNVSVSGGANIIQQLIKAGLLDEIQIHLAPVLLGGGRRLFKEMGRDHIEMEATRVIDSPAVTHLRFRVVK